MDARFWVSSGHSLCMHCFRRWKGEVLSKISPYELGRKLNQSVWSYNDSEVTGRLSLMCTSVKMKWFNRPVPPNSFLVFSPTDDARVVKPVLFKSTGLWGWCITHWHNLLFFFLDCVHYLIFKYVRLFESPVFFRRPAKKHLTGRTTYIELFSGTV